MMSKFYLFIDTTPFSRGSENCALLNDRDTEL
jgi:hypothetical protein